MNNLDTVINKISDLLDEMVDTMDIDASGNPDNAMRWATQVSDALVRLKRHTKADTKTHTDLCQEAQAGGGKAVTVDDIVAVTGTVLFSAGSQAEEVVTLQQIAEYLAENPLYPAPQAAVVNKQLLDALEECRFALEPYDDIKPRDWSSDRERLRRTHQSVKAILAAQSKEQPQ